MVNRASNLHDAPLVVYFHGNGEVCEEYAHWARLYQTLPCSFLVFDFRAYGWSTGSPEVNCLAPDAADCMLQLPELLRRYQLPWPWPAPVVLMGRSLGSAVAGSLIGRMPDMFQGLILDSG